MQQPANPLGYSLSVTNAGKIIFSYEGDVYSLPPTCWGPPPAHEATEVEKPNCTIANATKLTTGGADSDATWTESTQPIVVNTPPASAPGPSPSSTPPAATPEPAVSSVSQTKKNEHKHRCTHTVTAGALTFAAHAGVNTVHFDGLVSAHKKLKPGSYTLPGTRQPLADSGIHPSRP
jgi:hypothetical protein